MSNVTAVGIIIISLGLGFFIGNPILADISALSQTKSQYSKAIEDLKSIEITKQSLRQQLENLSPEDREKIETLLPSYPNMVKLVSDLENIASRNNITITDTSFTAVNNDFARSVSDAPPEKFYNSSGISISFNTSYERLKAFIKEIEQSLRLVDVRNITISASASNDISYKLTLETYWISSKIEKETQ